MYICFCVTENKHANMLILSQSPYRRGTGKDRKRNDESHAADRPALLREVGEGNSSAKGSVGCGDPHQLESLMQ